MTKRRGSAKKYAVGVADYWTPEGEYLVAAGVTFSRAKYQELRERLIELDEQPNRYLALESGEDIPDVPGLTRFTDESDDTLTDPAEGWLGDSYMGAWDDDPSPYDGNYSEM